MNTEQDKKRPKITIREMDLDDLAPLYHLGEKLFTATEVPNLYRTWDEYELGELFNSDSDLCLVAESERQLIGFALGTTIEKERSAWKYGHLVWLYMKRRHLPVIRQEVDEGRHNLIVSPSGKEAEFAFLGHLDTVTAYDLEDLGSQQDGDVIRGLGAADMKASCAAMVESFTCLWEQGYRDIPLAIALVVGEEEDGDGAEELVKDYHFPWAVIGEPTDLRPCLSHYGYLEIQLTTRGDRLHASLARRGRNAVQDMLQTLLKVSRYLERDRPEIVYNIRDLYSSGGGFVVPDACEAWIDLHLPAAAPVAEITLELEEVVAREQQENSSLDATIRFTTIHSGYELPEKGPVIGALKAVYLERFLPWEPLAFPSHSDANHLWSAGVKPVMLGCGQLEKAHSPEETISFQQVVTVSEIYFQLALKLLSSHTHRDADKQYD